MPNIAKMLIGLERLASGMHRKSVQIGDHRIFYSEGGSGTETLVMVHGFTSSADHWNRMAARLRKHYHIIALDLPGWGESMRIEAASYAYPAQVERLHQFVEQMGLKRFHLMGHSMGGGISARYASAYPQDVITLTLIAPHGVTEPVASDLAESVARGDNWLVVTSPAGIDRLMKKSFAKPPWIPSPVLKYLGEEIVRRSEKTGKIFEEIQVTHPPLLEKLSQIKAPTLIIWGDQDKLIHVSAAEIFHKGISGSELLILKGSGHMPLMENAGQCVQTFTEFIKKPHSSAEAAA